MNNLPLIKNYEFQFNIKLSRLLILAEGFEDRSLHWISKLPSEKLFLNSILCKYEPVKLSRLNELLPLVESRTINKPLIFDFHRYSPFKFESELSNLLISLNYDEVYIDISVMSKLMIMIIINCLKHFNKTIKFIYSEPYDYSPSQEKYNEYKNLYGKPLNLPSYGVYDLVRTPLLSSIIMQRSPSLVIAFLSFNEQLIRALLSFLNPTNLFLVNGVPPHLKWRENAMKQIHESIIKEFSNDNPSDNEDRLIRRTSTLYYQETFELLASIYKDYCYSRRIIIAPTGCKMQTIACALIKICCPDIHIEYPTPESYFTEGYSSPEIRNIHELTFNNFSSTLSNIAEQYLLNG